MSQDRVASLQTLGKLSGSTSPDVGKYIMTLLGLNNPAHVRSLVTCILQPVHVSVNVSILLKLTVVCRMLFATRRKMTSENPITVKNATMYKVKITERS